MLLDWLQLSSAHSLDGPRQSLAARPCKALPAGIVLKQASVGNLGAWSNDFAGQHVELMLLPDRNANAPNPPSPYEDSLAVSAPANSINSTKQLPRQG